jgi:hypothetical protein
MAAKKTPKKKPATNHRASTRLEALQATLEELTVVIRALMRDSRAASKYMASTELRLRGLERKVGLRK